MDLLVRLTKPTLFIFCLSLVFSCLLSATPVAKAQTNALNVTVMPKYPGPFKNVSITVEDYSRDLNNVEISWSVNGTVEQRGIGLKKFEFKTGDLGTVSNVSINMGSNTHRVAIRPAAVDLLWQANTYTPPFYRGKTLHSNQDPILIVAEPFFVTSAGTRLDPAKLIYNWKQNSKVDAAASGYGKKTFRITPSILVKPLDIQVEVSSPDNVYRFISSVNIPDTKPEIYFYENHPLYGIRFEEFLNGKEFVLEDKEINIFAAPFFFSREQESTDLLTYNWKLNSGMVNQTSNEITFRKPEGQGSGRALVSLDIKNLERFMQFANASFYVQFNNRETNTANQNIF